MITSLRSKVEAAVLACDEAYAAHEPSAALDHAIGLCGAANKHIDTVRPWVLAKDPAKRLELDTVLYELCETLRIVAILLYPVIPSACHEIYNQLNWRMELKDQEGRFSWADTRWGVLPGGHKAGDPSPIFPKIGNIVHAITGSEQQAKQQTT